MGGFAEYTAYDGLGLAELIRKRQVSAREVVEAALARIEALNPKINAVVTSLADTALAEADRPLGPGPFAGVPFLLKDLFTPLAGVPMTNGSRYFQGYRPPHDSELVSRHKAAGVIILGKTNTPEFGIVPVTEPVANGPTLNPWSLAHTPGGSSGGAAAAVASRMVPLAHGSDGGGSLRIPASCCGVFSLKPTRARNPMGPEIGEHLHGATVDHVISRTVRDNAAMLDATQGLDVGAPYAAIPPSRPYQTEIGAPPGRLRIAFSTVPPIPAPVHPDCIAATEDAARLCESLGHHVEEARPEIDAEVLVPAFLLIFAAETEAELTASVKRVGRPPRADDFEIPTRLLGLIGRQYSAPRLATAVRELHRITRGVGRFFQNYDVMLTPTLGAPPVVTGALQPKGVEAAMQKLIVTLNAGFLIRVLGGIEKLSQRVFDFVPFTPLFNVTGQPAMSVPLYWNAEGLPIGVQFAGRFGDEATLFRLAAQLEAARPWAGRRPPIS